ncbi:MAG: response regulator [Phycisphaeraceae bacterium]
MSAQPTVYVVEDDADVRKSLKWLLRKARLNVETCPSAEQFLNSYDPQTPGCVIVDVRMPGMSGLELQQALAERGWNIPVIVMSGHADVPTAVRAVQAGAMDFLEKPISRQVLLDRIHQAIEQDATVRRERLHRADNQARLARLTPRERQVMDMVVTGQTTKQIARQLDASARTIEVHRARLMKKTRVDSVAELVILAIRCGVHKMSASIGTKQ